LNSSPYWDCFAVISSFAWSIACAYSSVARRAAIPFGASSFCAEAPVDCVATSSAAQVA